MKLLACALLSSWLLITPVSLSSQPSSAHSTKPNVQALADNTVVSSYTPAPQGLPQTSKITILGVGDILLHQGLHMQALREPNGHQSLWSNVAPIIAQADIAYANLEGPTAYGVLPSGRETSDPGMVFDKRVYSSYPMFNYHDFLIDDLKQTGFDIVSTSNNHSLDRGALGLERTIDALNQKALPFVGTRKNETQPWVTILKKNGFTVAFVACTFSTNGLPDKKQQVMHCDRDRDELFSLVRKLKAHPLVDVIVATPHFGDEYQLSPNTYQKTLSRALVENGVHIVFGSHPHVVQPWEKHETNGHTGLIVYSLGNFVSGQFHRLHTRGSVLVSVTLKKDPQGVKIASAQAHSMEMVKQDGLYQLVLTDDETGNTEIFRHVGESFSPLLLHDQNR